MHQVLYILFIRDPNWSNRGYKIGEGVQRYKLLLPTGVLSKINKIVNYINLHIYHTYVDKDPWKLYETISVKLIL